ncbi:HCL082Cp [Eremothecium sinecaudum]|uniref:HCL082Cp n=1 Tax=Eremothecium sinecaudum TaxID=45286 RepID=A0A0X8HRE9_9SACH|nr:HCL082Cp [Eremothecium sinecaudum]AMD20069.1 HCL082Cp [Eremothecium sinecaudum]
MNGADGTGAAMPVQITKFKAAIGDLGLETLGRIEKEIENSSRHLERSTVRLRRYIEKLEGERPAGEMDELDEEIAEDVVEQGDLEVFREAVRENEIVLRNYEERLEAIQQERMHRLSNGGSDVQAKESVSLR